MPDPLPDTPRIVTAIVLLSMSSGLLDAAVYTQHGHVFANAMTGNLVLLGVSFLSGNASDVFRHLVPLLGFSAGVILGKYLLHFHRRISVAAALLLQMCALGVAGLLAQRIPANVLVALLAVTGAVIITVIRRTQDVSFNITFMTGNLRAVVEGAFDAILPHPSKSDGAVRGERQFLIVGLTCGGFLAGATLGAISSHRLQQHSF